MTNQDLANFIWQIADLLRGPYRPPQYERVMLPLVVLRRFDCVLADTKPAVLAYFKKLSKYDGKLHDTKLNSIAGEGDDIGFHNHDPLDFEKLKGDPDAIANHLQRYIDGFSENVRKIFDRFEFSKEIEKLAEANRLYLVVSKFADVDLSPNRVDNIQMGLLFEDLIRRFNEAANETAGDHFTPREVIRLMVNLLLQPDEHTLTTRGIIATVCDPACGTGGMLTEAQNWIREHNLNANVEVYGQDYNPRSFAVAASDLLIKGQESKNIKFGNTLLEDNFAGQTFDYLLANPPFGVDWKAEQITLSRQSNFHGYAGKLPRVNDGALLFLLYMMGHFQSVQTKDKKLGSRCAIVFNGSPLFAGGAGSGESEIRRWIIEHDRLEAIIALPENMFYNTPIGTFIWIVTNRKSVDRVGKIQLIDVRQRFTIMRKSLGDKRRYLDESTIEQVTREHGSFTSGNNCKIYKNSDFGHRRVVIERPLRLRFEMTQSAKEQFLDAFPDFFKLVEAVDEQWGGEPHYDWNVVWDSVQKLSEEHEVRWTASSKKMFRDCTTTTVPEAEPVIAKHGKIAAAVTAKSFPNQNLVARLSDKQLSEILGVHVESTKKSFEYEPDTKLRDSEKIPLKEHIVDFFLREVRPYVEDSWISRTNVDEQDEGIGVVGYEINFNREFFQYEPPRALKVIDKELAAVENRILSLLSEVTE